MKEISNNRGQAGAAKTEYIIMVLLIAVTSISAVSLFGDNIRALFGSADNALAGDEGAAADTRVARSLVRQGSAASGASSASGSGKASSLKSAQSAVTSSSSGSSSSRGSSLSNTPSYQAKQGGQAPASNASSGSGQKSLSAMAKAPAAPVKSAAKAAGAKDRGELRSQTAATTKAASSKSATSAAGSGQKGNPNAGARMSDAGLRHIMRTEGFRNKAYKDVAGYPTIGVGHLLTSQEKRSGTIVINGKAVSYKHGLTDEQIKDLLAQDVRKYEKLVADSVKVPLTQGQFDALVSFSYNVGPKAFKKSTLLRVLNQGKYNQVPSEMRKWVKAGGRTVKGLKNRREAEIALWNSGSSRNLVASKD